MMGMGSQGFSGTGWEKRGDRHGTFGSGMGSEVYGGRVFGQRTRSTGGSTESRQTTAPKREQPKSDATLAVGDHVSHKTFGPGLVVGVSGDMVEVQFSRTGKTKKLLRDFAPLVKIDS
jgi:DNA helicase-2/ATP-dependent DNA helicase PcrA